MDAIVTAGGINNPDDPLFALTGIEKKALIPLAGKPMIAWVVDAIWRSGLVEHIAVVGLEPGEVDFGDAPVCFTGAVGDLISNVLTGLDKIRQLNPSVKKILLASSDIPLITPEIVRGFVAECGSQEADGYYAIVEERTMEARIPGSKRTFVPFKGGRYSGGDLLLLDIAAAKANEGLLRSLTGSRKNYWNQARMLGLNFIIRFLLRTMTVDEAAERARARLNVNVLVVDTRYAEIGMDLDKPHQYELIKAMLEARESAASPTL
ncbi:MAG: NTP transferase domain-containing protein [Anaerolineae bacterium]|nr:NTP transferase domain-containing protein [Anaerolineae bacterium]